MDFSAKTCDRLGANVGTRKEVKAALARSGQGAWQAGYELGQSEAKEFLEGSGKEAFCELAWVFYGRNGQSVKNLLIRR